jgi:hypothetical protein
MRLHKRTYTDWWEHSHRDREAAKGYAHEQIAKLARGIEEIRTSRATVRRVLGLYVEEVTPGKCRSEQKVDHRRVEMWKRVLGVDREMERTNRRDWDRFIVARSSGAIDARGNPVPETSEGENAPKRRPVRAPTVAADLIFLQGVVNWACRSASGT